MAASLWPPGAPGRPAPDPGPALVRVALQAGATSVAHVDVAAMLSGICVALVPAAGVAGAVLVLHEPADPRDPERRRVFGSDTAATRIGQLQARSGAGPALRTAHDGRVLVTPDLARADPPGLAAVAAGCGLVRSLTVPVLVGAHAAGALQLLDRRDSAARPADRLAGALQVVTTALAARIRDVRELARLEQRAAAPRGTGPRPSSGERPPDRTALIPAARRPGVPPAGPRVPAQRRARHRRDDA
ncbi:hypothetical protein GCM10009613_42710 [Pseudonocardia kongjuensis]|uniref:GAF domain-containing protein n=1 Tax=Pseudonocardia kongjuensis TaxID=102227 RepID=A0ABN1Y0E8_9PSEU